MSPSDPQRLGDLTVFEGLKSATVLMIDDEPTTLDVMEMILRREGYSDLVKLDDSRQAFGTIRDLAPDALLLNLRMPEVSGLEILEALRADLDLASIPTIILTGSSDAEMKRRAFELGAADILRKPVDPSELILRLRNTLATRAYRAGTLPEGRGYGSREEAPAGQAWAEDRARKIVAAFLSRLEARVGAIEASLAAGDLEEVAELAHWLKGAAGTVGLHEFTVPAEALGRLARQGQTEGMEAIVQELRRMTAEANADQGR